MEGIVKGFRDVALGGDNGGDNREEDDGSVDRSRSTSWAQVVSGEDSGDSSTKTELNHGRNSNRKNEEWGSGGSEAFNLSQKALHEGNDDKRQQNYNQNEGEESNDGWETVGKKPSRRHHQVHTAKWGNFKLPATEQDYSTDVPHDAQTEPTEPELADLSRACNKLWDLDHNRLTPEQDYQIDCGRGKKSYQKQDMAEGTLFSWLGERVLDKPTFARFCSLLDNYNPHEGHREEVTAEERQEQAAFVEEICRTAPMKYVHRYLCAKGVVSRDYGEFKRLMIGVWFDLYGRGGTSGCSSAFEHVFVGEIKSRGEESVSGFHNWLQFYMEEAKGKVDYQGYIFPRRRGDAPDSETQLLTIQFEWNCVLKSVSSTMIGVSPEFEIALYTLCFYMAGEDNHVELGPYNVNIKCYRLGNKIGSVYPIAES